MARAPRAARKVPWKRSNPRLRAGKTSKHLTPAKKAAAKARARRAGRPYPNLVDNMRMASKKKKTTKKKSAKKHAAKTTRKRSTAKKSPRKRKAKASEKDQKAG